jgi:hypothetical protein
MEAADQEEVAVTAEVEAAQEAAVAMAAAVVPEVVVAAVDGNPQSNCSIEFILNQTRDFISGLISCYHSSNMSEALISLTTA